VLPICQLAQVIIVASTFLQNLLCERWFSASFVLSWQRIANSVV